MSAIPNIGDAPLDPPERPEWPECEKCGGFGGTDSPCPQCGGQGYVIEYGTESAHCPNCDDGSCGSCYDGAIPIQVQQQEPCNMCENKGTIPVKCEACKGEGVIEPAICTNCHRDPCGCDEEEQ